MILIYDDTYDSRKQDYPLDFLNEEKYKGLVTIIPEIIGSKVKEEEKNIAASLLVSCHKTIKFKTNDSQSYLAPVLNIRIFDSLEKLIRYHKIPYVSFSGQITNTTFQSENFISINKRDFYYNLKNLIDYYLETNKIEIKVLKYGLNFIGYELLSVQNNITYILNKYTNCMTLIDLLEKDIRIINELKEYNNISKIRPDLESFLIFVNKESSNISSLSELLNKITKSFLKYGKCIYNI